MARIDSRATPHTAAVSTDALSVGSILWPWPDADGRFPVTVLETAEWSLHGAGLYPGVETDDGIYLAWLSDIACNLAREARAR